jgi:hypothetical protein
MAPVREVPGLYRTLSSKGVTVSGATVTTGEGFKRKREVRVLSPPLRIPADDAARDVFVTVMIINRPLHGGINAPAGTDEMSRHDMSLFFAMLRSFPENQVRVSASLCSRVCVFVGLCFCVSVCSGLAGVRMRV